MPIVWLIVGALMVVVPFFLFDTPMDPWPSVTAGAIGAALFIIVAFFSIVKRTPFSKRTKIISTLLFLTAFTLSSVSFNTMCKMTNYQRELLGKIRTTIGEGILQSNTSLAMLPPFREYYQQKHPGRMSIGKLFLTMNKDRIQNGNYKFQDDQVTLAFLKDVSDSGVTLIMVDTVARGQNPDFSNIDGQIGRLQSRASLTKRGVRYEREN